MSNENLKLPDYPALAAVLIVDSKVSSRQELEKDIKSTSLFLDVKVAKSLATAKLTLELESIDALIVGPALTPAAAENLLSWASSHSRSKDCAYIVVLDKKPEGDLKITGAHAHTWRPLTKAKIFDAIIRGVVSVNKDSAWSSIFNNSEFHRQFDPEQSSPLLAPSAKRSVSEKVLNAPEEVIGLKGRSKASPDEIAHLLREKNLVFSSNGDPSSELQLAAIRILDALFAAGMSENERFVKHCTKAVYAWFENASLGGIQEANEQFKMSIWQFRG